MSGSWKVFLAVAGYGALHSLLASTTLKNFARRKAGLLADRLYRIAYNGVAVVTLVPVAAVLTANLGPVLYFIPWPGWAAAAGVQIAALLMLAVGFLQSEPASLLGLRQLGGPAGSAPLNTKGAYAVVRHPMYTCGLLFLWSCPIVTTGILAFNAAATLYILVGSEWEERRLIAEYGGEYLNYRSKVARLIPFLF